MTFTMDGMVLFLQRSVRPLISLRDSYDTSIQTRRDGGQPVAGSGNGEGGTGVMKVVVGEGGE